MDKIMELYGTSISDFEKPPKGYGIVPFYWWLGDKLTRERITWQMEKVRNHSISGLQINYAHGFSGGNSYGLTLESDPALFTDEWWELFEWFLKQGKKEGFAVSLSDYTLGTPGQGWYTDEIIEEHPDMMGYLLKEKHGMIKMGKAEKVVFPDNLLAVYVITDDEVRRISQEDAEKGNAFEGIEDGKLCVVYAEKQPFSINPMHPQAGKEVCKHFFDRFEEHAPGEGGKGLNFFFSDELNFGISGKLWDEFFAEEFQRRKGYDLCDYLPCLFMECGNNFAKIRLDYYDVIVAREEENYFQVVYDWHEKRNMIYGCDHGGRGYDLTEFGDYFRTQKYNQGPGCDQPNLASDIIKNKVASSISHLYGRKRTWLEGFYGSGWGTTSGEFMDAVTRNFVMGHNLLSVHGMYYSTYGGWWEWAPPCNTFHMPYWDDMGIAFGAIERMSYMLSQGVHRCDVAVLYPVMAVEGGVEADKAIRTAFDSVKNLYESGIDVDFIDYQSILDAEIQKGRIEKSGESYQVIILPEMRTVRLSMIQKLEEFCRRGGIVLGIGEPPAYCDSWDALEIKKNLINIHFNIKVEQIVDTVRSFVKEDVIFPVESGRKYMLHRFINGQDFYMVYGGQAGDEYGFHTKGNAVFWNPYDGKRYSLSAREKGEYVFVKLPLSGSELQLISFTSEKEAFPKWRGIGEEKEKLALSDEWHFSLIPCLDNQFGDYSIPASDEKIGAQVRMLHWLTSCFEKPGEFLCGGRECRCGFGPYYLKKGPFPDRERYLDAIKKAVQGEKDGFFPYEFSFRYGKWDDPGVQGYHGLKGKISDAFLTMGKKVETLIGTEYVPEECGKGYLFATYIRCSHDGEIDILCGDLKPEYLYIDGRQIENLEKKIWLSQGVHHVVAAYDQVGRTWLLFAKGEISEQKYPLSMNWYEQKNLVPLDGLYQEDYPKYEWYWFEAPPAVKSVEIAANGNVVVWVDGAEAKAEKAADSFGRERFHSAYIPQRKSRVVIRVENKGTYHGGACFKEPILLQCGEGLLKAGDWGKIEGLACYSGKVLYRQFVEIREENEGERMELEIDGLSSSAKVFVNGCEAGTKVSAPWLFDITPYMHKGKNEIGICVSNTLANHYRSIPSRYCQNTESGILGASRILFSSFGDNAI